MDKTTYISRKVMDRYMDKVTQRLERLWKRIVRLETQNKFLRSDLQDLLGDKIPHHVCQDKRCKLCWDEGDYP